MFSFAKKLVDKLEGAASSSEYNLTDSYFKKALQLNNKGYALRVLNVKPHSPAHQHGFESWFDYIIRINNHELPMLNPSLSTYSYSINEDGTINYGGSTTQEQAGSINYDLLVQELSTIAKTDKQITFDVWSAKGGIIRQITLLLNDYTPVEYDDSINNLFVNNFAQLGLTLQSQHLNTATYVWRILVTHQGSPAFQSQLVPYSDYIIGCDSAYDDDKEGKGLLAKGGEALLTRVVQSYYNYHYSITQEDNIPITLYVYNHDYDILRPVTVNLARSWGAGQNKGILGCDVGYGLLHRIPEVVGKFGDNDIIDDVLFESDQTFGYQTHTTPPPISPPSNAINPMANAGVFAPQAPAPPHRQSIKKKKHVNAALNGLNDYMNEELAKSKELDTQTNRSNNSDSMPPPPPKIS